MPFHTDSTGDVVGLFYREVSKSGGDLFVSPSWAVYNHLLVHYPEVVNVLMENWEWDL